MKTYVNATAQQVSSFDISKPYYNSVTGTDLLGSPVFGVPAIFPGPL